MAHAGYSGTPLVQKLGIKAGSRVAFVAPPPAYELLGVLPDVELLPEPDAPMDFIQVFCTELADLEARVPGLRDTLAPAGMLWVSWPKKASGAKTDLTGDVVRGIGLANGLVDVKVCAVDQTWSGLKFVRRKADRPTA